MLISQLTINVRYSFMSMSLSQRASVRFRGIKRWLLAFFITDEIFAVASTEDELEPLFFGGLAVLPYFGWALGTLFGSVIGNVLPTVVMNALCLAIYGMFLAAIAPKARASKAVLFVVLLAAGSHGVFYYAPMLKKISSGLTVSICAILAAVLGAIFFPVRETTREGDAA
jgi:predicted branched-subunit amino acid permease